MSGNRPDDRQQGAPSGSSNWCFPGVQYFVTGRYLQTTEGIENPLPTLNAIHDFSSQEKGFAYMSAFVDPTTRLSLIAGTSTSNFQIPDVTGAPLNGIVAPPFPFTTFNSAQAQREPIRVYPIRRAGAAAFGERLRRAAILFHPLRRPAFRTGPDRRFPIERHRLGYQPPVGYTNGIQGDASYLINPAHTLRAGFIVSAEKAWVDNTSLVEPCTLCDGTDSGLPESITDDVAKLGWLAGVYAQDEWRITNQLTMNAGLRFDQMWQFIDANQLSPRLSFTYKPFENTTFHAGYARYFTPPVLGRGGAGQYRLVQQHDGGAAGRPGQQPSAAGTVALPRCRRRSEDSVGMPCRHGQRTAPCSISASTPITRTQLT